MTHLPDRRPATPARAPHGPTGVPLSRTPSEALAFALGYIAARPVSADQYGGVCALVEELMARNIRVDEFDRWDDRAADGSLWNALFAFMPPELARALQTLYMAHRGQRWANSTP